MSKDMCTQKINERRKKLAHCAAVSRRPATGHLPSWLGLCAPAWAACCRPGWLATASCASSLDPLVGWLHRSAGPPTPRLSAGERPPTC